MCLHYAEEKEMKKNDWKNRVKRIVASLMLICMLFGAAGATGAAGDTGIMPCGVWDDVIEEL